MVFRFRFSAVPSSQRSPSGTNLRGCVLKTSDLENVFAWRAFAHRHGISQMVPRIAHLIAMQTPSAKIKT
jgi:hypothetical protein